MRSITLYIPGLFGPDISILAEDLPDLPALNWLLSRGEKTANNVTSPSYGLCQLFGLSSKGQSDLPIAAITRLSDDNQHPEGCWLRVDPVNVTADRDGLILIDRERFQLNQRDACALAAEVNYLLKPYGVDIEVPDAYRWYLKMDPDLNLKTTPLDNVIGKDILPFMPDGNDRFNLIQLMNDIQMTLHQSEINKKREQEKLLPINSVWFWGYGELPKIIDRQWSFIVSDEMVAKGLSMIAATPFQDLPEKFSELELAKKELNGLIVINAFQKYSHYHDLEGWLEALIEYELNWFSSLKSALKGSTLDKITIKTQDSSFEINKSSCFKIWKRTKPLVSHL